MQISKAMDAVRMFIITYNDHAVHDMGFQKLELCRLKGHFFAHDHNKRGY